VNIRTWWDSLFRTPDEDRAYRAVGSLVQKQGTLLELREADKQRIADLVAERDRAQTQAIEAIQLLTRLYDANDRFFRGDGNWPGSNGLLDEVYNYLNSKTPNQELTP
jgi:hypothetical protein